MRGEALEIVAVSLLTFAGLAAVSFGLAGRGRLTLPGAASGTCLVAGGVLLAVPPLDDWSIPALGSGLCAAALLVRVPVWFGSKSGRSA